MEWIEILGLAAGFMTTASFLPQAVKVWRSKSTKDVSLGMFLMMCLGVFLWLVYGVMKGDMPIIAANSITLGLALSILVCKIKYG